MNLKDRSHKIFLVVNLIFCIVIRLGLGHLGHRGLKHLYAWPGRVKKETTFVKYSDQLIFTFFCPALQIFTLASKILLSLIKNLCYGIKKCGVLQKWSPGRAGWRALPSPPPVQPATQLSSLTRPANQLFKLSFIGNLWLSKTQAQGSLKEKQNIILVLRSCKNIVCSSNQQVDASDRPWLHFQSLLQLSVWSFHHISFQFHHKSFQFIDMILLHRQTLDSSLSFGSTEHNCAWKDW